MKKLTFFVMIAFLMLSFNPTQLKAGFIPISVTSVKVIESTEANALIIRLQEIKEMDKSKLTSPEKKELRNEVRTIKDQLKRSSGGVYLSAGAIIIIVLLLLLLL